MIHHLNGGWSPFGLNTVTWCTRFRPFYLPLKKRGRWETKPVGLWTEGSPYGDSREAIAYWQDAKSQTTRKPKSLTEQMARQISSVYGKRSRGWHKEITKQGIASPTSSRKKLVTTKAFKAYSREILSWIAQLKIDNGDIGEYFQKDSLKKRLQL